MPIVNSFLKIDTITCPKALNSVSRGNDREVITPLLSIKDQSSMIKNLEKDLLSIEQ